MRRERPSRERLERLRLTAGGTTDQKNPAGAVRQGSSCYPGDIAYVLTLLTARPPIDQVVSSTAISAAA